MNKKDIYKNIKKNSMSEAIKSFLFALLFLSMSIFFLIGILNYFKLDFENIFMIFCTIGFFFIFIICFNNFYKNIIIFINPYKYSVSKIYGDLYPIFEEIFNNIEYQDSEIIISKKYLLCKYDYRMLLKLNDVLGVYKTIHKTNYHTDAYILNIFGNHSDIIKISYSKKEEETVNNIIFILSNKCNNAYFGYTNETLSHIKENTTK